MHPITDLDQATELLAKQADPRTIGQAVQNSYDKAQRAIEEADLKVLGYSPETPKLFNVHIEDCFVPLPKCETDKPIGTRDPDKYLKEQQNAARARMMK